MSDNLPNKILIIDSDKSIGQGMKLPLERHQIKVDVADTAESALYLFNQNIYPVVIIELAFEELPGLVFAQKWRQHESRERRCVGLIMAAGNRNDREPEEAKLKQELEGIELIYKPFNAIQILPILQRAYNVRQRNMKIDELGYSIIRIGQKRDRVDKAVGMVKKNLKELGNHGIRLMMDIYEQHGMWEECLAVVDSILQRFPQNIALMNAKGRILLKLGKAKESLMILEKCDSLAPNNIERIDQMSIAYLDVNDPDRGVTKMKQLIHFNPDNPDLKFHMLSRLYERGFDLQAQALCHETASPMEVVRYYNNRGVALSKSGQVDEAILEYERALKLYPKFKENYRIFYNIALAHISKKKRSHHEYALEYLNRALALRPNFDKAKRTKDTVTDQLSKKRKGKTNPKAS
ncbi:tetratricopeptide repeat protein [Pseudobacteriovorax antillogorgiicola]|uniref:Tetratricopeptide repeat-containing protein n=1 Tax=Pseudobacteriovorax antillogorgiicola TaxID=1513793 RepID=A0A1Y6CGV2_9BACT|nr:tetratricopeptide repeat protein [Pseudobacteriovorax antillogorgiicola]TCS48641.1 tetratricopeptide repeat protein [Pseudobacteriovorax antillogorgiicola]SMF55280.1 Tetratricopeptide repeat-containing protein [Pseudobacteriovorax antillogorgiicola]